MTAPGYQPLNPVEVEQKLRHCIIQLYAAEKTLADCRDSEVNAELHYRSEHRKALLSDDCPKVSRGGVTVTERDAWVEQQCAAAFDSYRRWQAQCQAAQDHVRITRDVTSTVQSIASLVRQAYSMAGQS
jgi:hypothetical protein